MAPLTPFSLSQLTLLGLLTSGALSTTFTMVNKCEYAVWPGILSNPGAPPFPTAGFALEKDETMTLIAPASWRGRLWGRTLCTLDSTGNFSCVTGDCGSGKQECSGSGAATTATLAEFSLDGFGGLDFFDISLVDGYNLPMLVVPEGGTGTSCTNTGCVVDLNSVCPSELKVTSGSGSEVVGCKSACEAFQQPQYCCSGADKCKPSSYSQIFKNACPQAYSYALDDATSTFACANANYTITFCPSPNTRLPSLHNEDDPQYTQCKQPFNCGNLTDISYPFWGGPNRPQECGRLGFELTNCEDETQLPHIVIEKLDFHVSNINSQDLLHTMTIARSDLWDNPCTDLLVNTTLDYNRFSYVQTVRNLTLYYGCLPQNEPVLNNFTCKIDGTTKERNISYYVDDSLSRVDVPGGPTCSTKIIVPTFWEGFDVMPDNATEEVEKVLKQGFQVEYRADWDLCRLCMNSNGTCGSNATTDSFLCLCGDRPSNSTTCPITPIVHGTKFNWKTKVFIGVAATIAGSCILLFVILFRWTSLIRENDNEDAAEAFIRNIGPLAVQRYKFSDVRKMTNSFKDKLGQGGYGDVYEGKLLNGCRVAVKVLKESKGNGEDFVNEVASISRTSHVNVVTLLGYCFEGKKKALIYEFMPNGSLEKFIYKDSNLLTTTPHLELEKLFQIAIGIARGLEYLHRGCNTRILHFDIKPHNILLDEDFCPKISDFGLSKLCTRKESIISMLEARGTIGYIAPEVFSRNFGRVSAKSDVYSYGMMILEMVGGRKKVDARVSHTSEIYFPDWVYEHLEQGSNFGLLNAATEEEKELARKMILVGLWCIQTKPSDRPSMSKVIEMLEGSTEALQIPPKPVLSSPQFTTDKSESIVLLLYINIHKQCNVQDLIRTSNTVDCIF
ncbi:PR5-like receptor kinase isoform X2 [Rosa chinensis]|uniref:PR5-like receptor kinase isoform X2 n=1 Tax=Rosa chinensis TaxID=74649 RepID=UPI000D09073A|nr:PR5-like receptor kinase isoform X2 [Rosa chinensis]